MNWTGYIPNFGFGRLLVLLRRIATAIEEGNRLVRIRLDLDYPSQRRRGFDRVGESPKLVDISYPTAEEWNDDWRETHPDSEEAL